MHARLEADPAGRDESAQDGRDEGLLRIENLSRYGERFECDSCVAGRSAGCALVIMRNVRPLNSRSSTSMAYQEDGGIRGDELRAPGRLQRESETVARAPIDHQHRGLHRAAAKPLQELLAGLKAKAIHPVADGRREQVRWTNVPLGIARHTERRRLNAIDLVAGLDIEPLRWRRFRSRAELASEHRWSGRRRFRSGRGIALL